MTYAEYVEWRLFNNVWPIGEKRQDLNFAQLCSVMAAQFSTKPIPLQDFVMFKDRDDPVEDVEEEETPLNATKITDEDLSSMFGGKVKRIGKK